MLIYIPAPSMTVGTQLKGNCLLVVHSFFSENLVSFSLRLLRVKLRGFKLKFLRIINLKNIKLCTQINTIHRDVEIYRKGNLSCIWRFEALELSLMQILDISCKQICFNFKGLCILCIVSQLTK